MLWKHWGESTIATSSPPSSRGIVFRKNSFLAIWKIESSHLSLRFWRPMCQSNNYAYAALRRTRQIPWCSLCRRGEPDENGMQLNSQSIQQTGYLQPEAQRVCFTHYRRHCSLCVPDQHQIYTALHCQGWPACQGTADCRCYWRCHFSRSFLPFGAFFQIRTRTQGPWNGSMPSWLDLCHHHIYNCSVLP